jgi:hypothetical protein
MYKNSKEADHAFYMRHRDRLRRKRTISPNNKAPNGEDTHVLTPNPVKAMVALHVMLVDAARWNVDREADVAPDR